LLIEEGEDQRVVDEHVLPARLVLELLDLRNELLVCRGKRQLRLPLAGDERLANEDLARGRRVDDSEIDAPVHVDDETVQRRPLEGDELPGLLLPVRIEQLLLEQVATDLLDPPHVDVGDASREEPRRFDQLGGDDPAARLLREVRARMAMKADAARSE